MSARVGRVMRRSGGMAALAIVWTIASVATAQSADALDAPVELEEVEDLEVPDAPSASEAATVGLELPVPPHLRLDVARLGAFFEDEANQERDGTVVSSVFEITLGAGNLGLGLWLMFDDVTFGGFDMLRATGGALGIPLGLMSIVSGIYALTTMGVAQDRNARWRAALAGGLDERSLGRFEGELRAEAETARVLRGFEAVTNLAIAGGGLGLVLATAAASLDESGQIYGYGFGGLYVLVGLIGGLSALFTESRAESNWQRYQDGGAPEGPSTDVTFNVTPTVSDTGLGVSIQGTF
ncbi:MAG: hypothetical protein H6719_34470 [Sandaracinaceae bacterium]|nr:hypothetical protein [Sandaracinaceae bacterium]